MNSITLAHGSGGRLSHNLIQEIFQKHLTNKYLDPMNDAAIITLQGKIAVTTDSFVISPLFFKGGDIGKLSVCGTVNDLAVSGAKPEYLTLGLVLEEGLLLEDLETIIASIAETAKQADVKIVCGDTKVVERGKADKIFINTTGIGCVPFDRKISPEEIKPGDLIIATGTFGDHGIAILSEREGLEFTTEVTSDCAPLNNFIESFYFQGIKCMRDPTRGGTATVLNELAQQAGVSMLVKEESIPVHPGVKGACDMLGLDPLYLANEGKAIVITSEESAEKILEKMRLHPYGRDAAIIGRIEKENPGLVLLETKLGSKRILGMLEGEHLPRIC